MKLGVRSRVTADDVIDGLTTAVVALDEGLRVSTINSAAEGLFEVSRRLALGAPLVDAIPHFTPQELRLRRALDTSTGFIGRETKLVRNGAAVVVDLT
ncbi:MAG: PAS domain-containing protein, partial [Solimonas sp.]